MDYLFTIFPKDFKFMGQHLSLLLWQKQKVKPR